MVATTFYSFIFWVLTKDIKDHPMAVKNMLAKSIVTLLKTFISSKLQIVTSGKRVETTGKWVETSINDL